MTNGKESWNNLNQQHIQHPATDPSYTKEAIAPAEFKTQNAPIKTQKLRAECICFAVRIKELRAGGGEG